MLWGLGEKNPRLPELGGAGEKEESNGGSNHQTCETEIANIIGPPRFACCLCIPSIEFAPIDFVLEVQASTFELRDAPATEVVNTKCLYDTY